MSKRRPKSGYEILSNEIERSPQPMSEEDEKDATPIKLYKHNMRYAAFLARKFFKEGDYDKNERALSAALLGLWKGAESFDSRKVGAVHFRNWAHSRILWCLHDEFETRRLQRNTARGSAIHYEYSEGYDKDARNHDAQNFRSGLYDNLNEVDIDIGIVGVDLRDAMDAMENERMRYIVYKYFGFDGSEGCTLQELSNELATSKQSIHQLKEVGITQIKNFLIRRYSKYILKNMLEDFNGTATILGHLRGLL